jgi:hypothetical protein
MVRLKTLGRRLQREQPHRGILLFDEGPVFALAWLRGFGHWTMRSASSDGWWRATLAQWARVIDAVVVLDAPDALLAYRIRTRPVWHEVKDLSDAEIAAWMQRFRSALDWVLAGLTASGGPAVIRISCGGESPDEIAVRVLGAVESVSHDH